MEERYISITISCGQATITVRRPVLDDGEREKRAKQIETQLSRSLQDYLKKC